MLDAKHRSSVIFPRRAKIYGMTKQEKELTASQMGRKGARKRAETLTKKQRSDIAKKAAKARWKEKP